MSAPAVSRPKTSPGSGGLRSSFLKGERVNWQRRYVLLLLGLDVVLLGAVTLAAVSYWFGSETTSNGLPYRVVAAFIMLTWVLGLAASRSYEASSVLTGAQELLRVTKASCEVFAAVALFSFLTKAHVSRGYLLLVFPFGLLALLVNRLVAHRLLRRARLAGHAQHRVLIVGNESGLQQLVDAFARDPQQGHRVVAACLPRSRAVSMDLLPGTQIPVVSTLAGIPDAVIDSQADTVAVAPGVAISDTGLRRLCYDLEGMDIDILVAPSLTDVAGTRVSVRPVAGLPLLHLDEPELDGVHKLIKGTFDRTAAALGLLLLWPVLCALYFAVRFSSPGGALFKQPRVGKDGEIFKVWKFRSMYPDAEARLADLMQFNEHEGPLFKMKNDPRITPIGRFLRKWSLDELPQLVNVLKGDMSLVGPRPPLPAEVAKYDGHAHRRLLVKPGITGLWQVSGRADLDWEQAIRLDLAYVDGWSLGFDLAILARTAMAVIKGSGAY